MNQTCRLFLERANLVAKMAQRPKIEPNRHKGRGGGRFRFYRDGFNVVNNTVA